jgi:hypothetical protein
MTYEMWEAHDRTCRCADCYSGPPSKEWCGHCGKRWDYCECSPIVDQCALASCHAPIFEGSAMAEDSEGYRYHAQCFAAVQADEVIP